MNCGTVLFDKNFQFSDGATSDKLLIVVCEFGTDHLILVTTSRAHSKGRKYGCQLADKPSNFFLPKGSCWFDRDTWVELHEVIELSSTIHEHKKKDGAVVEHRNVLSADLMKSILDCALQSEFIDEFYLDSIRKIREAL